MMRLSIITINRNNRQGLERTIKSVICQSDRSFEYIVIDGDSTDGSAELLKKYEKDISFSVSEPDSGIYNAMNKGARMSSAEYLLFLNSGDTLHDEHCIEKILPNLKTCVFIIGRYLKVLSGTVSDIGAELSLMFFYKGGTLPHPATFILRKSLIESPYDETLSIVSDWKFFVQQLIFQNARFKWVDLIISDFEGGGVSSDKIKCQIERNKALSDLLPALVIIDYLHFVSGSGYQNSIYDDFYLKIRDSRYGKFVYTVNCCIIKIISIFKKSAGFIKSYPVFIKD